MVMVSAVAVIFCGSGCSPHKSAGSTGGASDISYETGRNTLLEGECEQELLYLGSLIEARQRSGNLSAAVLAEAIELRRVAAGLILDAQYDLALELIEEAIALLREP